MKQKEYEVSVPLRIGASDLRKQKAILYKLQDKHPEYDGHLEGLLQIIDAIEDECKLQGWKHKKLPVV